MAYLHFQIQIGTANQMATLYSTVQIQTGIPILTANYRNEIGIEMKIRIRLRECR